MTDGRGTIDGIYHVLKMVAPGTALREGLENVLRATTGALIVLGETPEIRAIVDGGFRLENDFTPANLYELAKMDGAIILSHDAKKILMVNTMLTPDTSIPSSETGIRHRTAERVARSTGLLTISISQRRNIITLYKDNAKYPLRDISVILSKANQALQTLDKYQAVLKEALMDLSILEFDDMVSLSDVAKTLQRFEMVTRVAREISRHITELGVEGRLIKMQLDELVGTSDREGYLLIRDFCAAERRENLEEIEEDLSALSAEDLLDLNSFCRVLGYGSGPNVLEKPLVSRGYRILNKVPRLPFSVIENIVETCGTLNTVLIASGDELDDIEGIGEARARTIKDGLARLRQQLAVDRRRL